MAAVLADVDVAAAAMASDAGPISTSKAIEATNHAAPVTTANPPSFCATGKSMRRD